MYDGYQVQRIKEKNSNPISALWEAQHAKTALNTTLVQWYLHSAKHSMQ